MYTTEWAAFNWLCEERKLSPNDLFHGTEFSDPTFVYMGNIGYEVKVLTGVRIFFERGKYGYLRSSWDGEVVIFKLKSEVPKLTVPFSKLPREGGMYSGINIVLHENTSPRQQMVAIESELKYKLEAIRGIIETHYKPQKSWGDLMLQSLCAMICDQKLMRFTDAVRIAKTYFLAECPYCEGQNKLDVGNQLYWLKKCDKCGREFVAKYKTENKIL